MARLMVIAASLVFLSPPVHAAKIKVAATFLPVWIFAENVAGGRAGVSLLVPPGTDVHEFSLRPLDLRLLHEADLVVMNGAGLERHFIRPLDYGQRLVDSSQGIEIIGQGARADPHIWLDPLLAKRQVENIRDALSRADPENAEFYKENARAYTQRLIALHAEIREALRGMRNRRLITFHESFNYFARRYGLLAYSLTGRDAEQPLPQRMKEVYDIVRKEGVRAIFSEAQFSEDALGRLREDLGVGVCPLDTLESGLSRAGYYEEAMRENLRSILKCMGDGK